MNVWTVFPTANPELAKATIPKWQAMGYKVAILSSFRHSLLANMQLIEHGPYPGYWACVNSLVGVVKNDADLFVAAADDMHPDPSHTAQEIGEQYLKRFPGGFGLMQPCGDRQGSPTPEAPGTWNSMRICGSPWFGHGWIERAFGGEGPMPQGPFHYYGDEALYEIAKRMNVLWMRPDLIQDHLHWSFGRRPLAEYNERNQKYCQPDHDWFQKQKAEGFKTMIDSFLPRGK